MPQGQNDAVIDGFPKSELHFYIVGSLAVTSAGFVVRKSIATLTRNRFLESFLDDGGVPSHIEAIERYMAGSLS